MIVAGRGHPVTRALRDLPARHGRVRSTAHAAGVVMAVSAGGSAFRGAGRAYSPTRVFWSWLEQMHSGVHNTRSSAIIAALLTRRSSLPNSALMRSAAAAIEA